MLMSTLPHHVVNPKCRCPNRHCRCWIPFLRVDVVDFLLSMLLSEDWWWRALLDEPVDVKAELVARMPDVHPILCLLRWDDVVGAILPILLLTTDADVVVVVAFVVYRVVDEVVECHLDQPLDVEVLLCLCFDVLLVDRWADDDAGPFFPRSILLLRWSLGSLGVMQGCFDELLVLLDVLLLLDVLFFQYFCCCFGRCRCCRTRRSILLIRCC